MSLKLLWHLQELDRKVASLEAQQAQPGRVGEFAERLEKRSAHLDRHRAGLAERQRQLRVDELDLKTKEALVQILEGKLYGGVTTGSRELLALEGELIQAKQLLPALEDRILERMEAVEQLEGQTAKLQADRMEAEEDLREAHDDERERQAVLEGRLCELAGQRLQARSQIGAALVKEYDDLSRGGRLAVSKAKGGQCLACHMSLSDAVQRNVVAGLLERCNNCGCFVGMESKLT